MNRGELEHPSLVNLSSADDAAAKGFQLSEATSRPRFLTGTQIRAVDTLALICVQQQ